MITDQIKRRVSPEEKDHFSEDPSELGGKLDEYESVRSTRHAPHMPHPSYATRPMVVTEILPSGTYRISQLESSNGRLYATTAHISQLEAWRSWNEDDDDSSENSDDEP
ncbi:hypothetical protein AVEN_128632-1 [Araneus ventricosus]|uniref:Uncharacterized protein n=1 Tax=Araneus ventricosus TaxID=182803 RepID=A0A4Y2KJ34_ARAVE|nr:hypothetical protein AVEN_128632-1 [Araneus ventricosus]